MSSLSLVFAPAALEFAVDTAAGAFSALVRQAGSLELGELAIVVGLVVGLYLLVKHM
jgi:uncharacterized protein YqgC (DUF456 family)